MLSVAVLLYGGFIVRERLNLIAGIITGAALATGSGTAFASDQKDDGNFCMTVEIEPFHLMPDGTCTVRDYFDGELQEMFYPFTEQDHLFNCEVFGPAIPMPFGEVPSSVASIEPILGTIDGHPFEANLMCASLTNWYQEWCPDPSDKANCLQLAQPFMNFEQPFPRVTEVSLFDGVVTVAKNKNQTEMIPVVMATRASGITHVEDLSAPLVGASFTHDLLGLVTYKADAGEKAKLKELEGSADLLLQGHIFFPGEVSDDPGAARIKGTICSKDLYKLLNQKGGRKGGGDD
jgi:hypothetical protein